MAIDTIAKLRSGLSGGQKFDFFKSSQTTEGAGTWHSSWKLTGFPTAGSNPGSLAGAVPDNTTAGAFPLTFSGTSYVLEFQATNLANNGSTLILYDRLWANSTMSGTVTTDTTLGSVPALTRPDANGADVEMWGCIYTAIGATGATLTVKYTNQAGTTGQTATYVHPANAESVGQMFPIQLQAGDTGVRVPTSYSWSISTGTAGDFGIILLRRTCSIPVAINNYPVVLDAFRMGIPRIDTNACLSFMRYCAGTSTGNDHGRLIIGQG